MGAFLFIAASAALLGWMKNCSPERGAHWRNRKGRHWE